MRISKRVTLITRPTRLAGLLQRWGTRSQVSYKFRANKIALFTKAGKLDHAAKIQAQGDDIDFRQIENEDLIYRDAMSQMMRDLDLGVPAQAIDRSFIPTYDFSMSAAVVVLGQDGLVANAAKYVGGIPILGINPDPAQYDGVLLPFQLAQARDALRKVLDSKHRVRNVTLAEVKLQDGQQLLAFNDLFIGMRSHASARYKISINGQTETQSSSGVLISTGAGSTGWMSSIYNMAAGMAVSQGLTPPQAAKMNWDTPALLWAVREPFVSRTSQAGLVCGRLEGNALLKIESMTPENGVIFSDGVEADALEFNAGTIATIGIAAQRACLVVP